MLQDSSNSSQIDKQVIIAAIESLLAKGWDINPYTVADEVQMPCSSLYRSAELMDLIAQARKANGKNFDAADYEPKEQIELLSQHNRELESLTALLEHEKRELMDAHKHAWQDGYWAAVQQLSTIQTNDLGKQSDSYEDDSLKPFTAEKLQADDVSEETLRELVKNRLFREEQVVDKQTEIAKKVSGSQFVGSHKGSIEPSLISKAFARSVPPPIRKACLMLGVKPEELSYETVSAAWKKEMSNPGGHPDLGGETEIAIYLNTARDTLNRYLDAQAPKLGKKFGSKIKKTLSSDENDE